jgi:hypothetical protein
LSLNKKQNNVEVVLPPSGSGFDSGSVTTNDPKVYKQNLKTRINNLKLQQRDTQGTIKALEKELNKISKPVAKKATSKKATNNKVSIVKKGKNEKRSKNKK